MVNYCAIVGCTNRGGRDKVSFFRLPAEILNQGEKTLELSRQRRRKWLSRISRGKPSTLYDDSNVDWAPTVMLGHEKLGTVPTPERGERIRGRQKKRVRLDVAKTLLSLKYTTESEDDMINDQEHNSGDLGFELEDSDVQYTEGKKETHVQTDVEGDFFNFMECEIHRLNVENADLKDQLASSLISVDMFKDDWKVKLYTGLPNSLVLMTLFTFIESSLPYSHNSALSPFQQMMLVLIRLKLNLPVQYMADVFRISSATVSKVFQNTLNVLYIRLKPLIYWPDREELRLTMPVVFRRYFGLRVAVIVDCFEIFIERPSNLKARAQTWSSYKHHNTRKYLIGITPQGSISFISNGYGGRVSDKYITNDCDLLKKLVFGDVVLADRGFDNAESVAQASAELKIPALTKGKSQLSAFEVEQTRKLASVRIHVERVIGLVRNKFTMLQDTLPVDYLVSNDNSVPTIDKIVTVCCALTNMCKSVVPFE